MAPISQDELLTVCGVLSEPIYWYTLGMKTPFFSMKNETHRKILIAILVIVVLGVAIYSAVYYFKKTQAPVTPVNPENFTVQQRLDMLKQLDASSHQGEVLPVEKQQAIMDADKKSKSYIATQKIRSKVTQEDINNIFNSLK